MNNLANQQEELFYIAVFEHPFSSEIKRKTYGVCLEGLFKEHVQQRESRERGYCIEITFFTRNNQKEAFKLTDRLDKYLRARKSKTPLTEEELKQFR
ncbi:hypothetical protein COV15_02475 [Candidatus Woesearchaeota archaeon CG10_big_fil_rev_8_21_14_0_10_34_12]|nr:MAG: hypothetical protein COV15_02475 [Candidatus Woesearchaeota archaeon CG10_big_fil_rev_8_21_14_0_10_34_12]